MAHNHHGGHSIGLFMIVAAIAFAFGARTARIVVGSVLIVVAVLCAWVAFLVVMDQI